MFGEHQRKEGNRFYYICFIVRYYRCGFEARALRKLDITGVFGTMTAPGRIS